MVEQTEPFHLIGWRDERGRREARPIEVRWGVLVCQNTCRATHTYTSTHTESQSDRRQDGFRTIVY